MSANTKRLLTHLLRIVVCAAALWFVARGVTLRDQLWLASAPAEPLVGSIVQEGSFFIVQQGDGTTRRIPESEVAKDEQGNPRVSFGLATALQRSNKTLLLVALLIYFPVIFPQALRLLWLVRAQGIRIGYWESLKLSFAGNFLNFATPLGSNAGDVFKAYFLAKHTEHKTEAVTTILLDRIIGFGTLLFTVALITLTVTDDQRLGVVKPYVLTGLAVGMLVVLAYLSPLVRGRLVPKASKKWISRLPMFEHLQRVDSAARKLAGQIPTVLATMALTAFLQIQAMGAYVIVAIALGLKVTLATVPQYYAYFYTGLVVQAMPGPPQGLGTVELVYRYFLEPFGSPSQIICVAFLARVMVLVSSLPGLIVTLSGSYKPQNSTFVEQPVALRN